MATNRYTSAGVNNAAEASLSRFAGAMCSETSGSNPLVQVIDRSDHFRGNRSFTVSGSSPQQHVLVDGMGVKPLLIAATGNYGDAGLDLLTAVWGDAVRKGMLPLLLADFLAINSLNVPGATKAAQALLAGLQRACGRAGIVLYTGEIAQHGVQSEHGEEEPGFHFEWAAFMLAIVDPGREILGELRPGQLLIACHEPNHACNGSTAIVDALKVGFGKSTWWRNAEAHAARQAAAQPSTLVEPFLQEVNGWGQSCRIPVAGIAHVTGGGFKEKLLKDLLVPSEVSAILDNLFPPPAILQQSAEWLGMDAEEAYTVWACGNRFIVAVEPEYRAQLLDRAAKWGVEARVCGRIVDQNEGRSTLILDSKFGDDETVQYIAD